MVQRRREKDDEKFYEEFSRALDAKIIANGEGYWHSLSVPEKTAQVIRFLDWELQNGGIEQYFINPASNRWKETLAALKRISATRIVAAFETALSVFPNATPSASQLKRSRQYKDAGRHAADLLFRLDDEYDHNDLIPLLVAYLRDLDELSN